MSSADKQKKKKVAKLPGVSGDFVVTQRRPSGTVVRGGSGNEEKALREAEKLVSELSQSFFKTKNPDIPACQALLRKIKLLLVHFHLVPPFHSNERTAHRELACARSTFEIAAMMSIPAKDTPAFERHIAQLKPFYYEFSDLLPRSEYRLPLLGLHMTSLLAANKISEFHTEMELLPEDALASSHIQFPIELEQALMEGSYNAVLLASERVPFPHFRYFTDTLVDVVRDRISDCCEEAYSSMTVKVAMRMLKLQSEAQLNKLASQRDWKIADGTVTFPDRSSRRSEIAAEAVIDQTLEYATELERIV